MMRQFLPFTKVYAGSSTEAFVPVTGWLSTRDITEFRGVVELTGVVGNLSVKLGFQTAHEHEPTTVVNSVAFGGALTADGIEYPAAFHTPTSPLGEVGLIRFGFMASASSGIGTGTATASIETRNCA